MMDLDQVIEIRQRELDTLIQARELVLQAAGLKSAFRPVQAVSMNNGKPKNTAEATEVILRDYPAGLHLKEILMQLENRFNMRSTAKDPVKNLRSQLDRWLEGNAKNPKFRRTQASTYALFSTKTV